MERVSRYLELQSGPVSKNQVEQDVKGSGPGIRTALHVLAAEGYIETTTGARNALLVTSRKPYREEAEEANATSS